MRFIWESIRAATLETLLPELNHRMLRLQELLQDLERRGKFLWVRGSLRLRSPAHFEAQAVAPDAPDANSAAIYLRDNGAGKMQVVVKYPGGAINIIDTEP